MNSNFLRSRSASALRDHDEQEDEEARAGERLHVGAEERGRRTAARAVVAHGSQQELRQRRDHDGAADEHEVLRDGHVQVREDLRIFSNAF